VEQSADGQAPQGVSVMSTFDKLDALRAAGLHFDAGHLDYKGWLTLYGCPAPPRRLAGWQMQVERVSVVDALGMEREQLIVRMREGA
jgi:hypothetical protein